MGQAGVGKNEQVRNMEGRGTDRERDRGMKRQGDGQEAESGAGRGRRGRCVAEMRRAKL